MFPQLSHLEIAEALPGCCCCFCFLRRNVSVCGSKGFKIQLLRHFGVFPRRMKEWDSQLSSVEMPSCCGETWRNGLSFTQQAPSCHGIVTERGQWIYC